MNFKYTITLLASYLMLVAAESVDDSADQERRLSEIYDKMKNNSGNVAINLDSTFGGGRCNCVCKDNL